MIKGINNEKNKWSEKEIEMLLDYEFQDDSETLDERLEHARYMLYYENGLNFPHRTLSAIKNKFYKECNKKSKNK